MKKKEGEDEPTAIEKEKSDDEDYINALETYKDLNDKAIGNICICLHYTIGYQFDSEDQACHLWEKLETRYAKPGFTQLFLELKGAINTPIPYNADPRPAIDKILTHFTCLWENQCQRAFYGLFQTFILSIQTLLMFDSPIYDSRITHDLRTTRQASIANKSTRPGNCYVYMNPPPLY